MSSELIEQKQTGQGTGSYVSGALGALLGALIGAVPLVAVGAIAGLYSGWLGFLVGIGAAKGYQILRGARKTGYAMTMVTVASVGVILVSVWVSALIVLMNDPQLARYSMARQFDLANRFMAENIGLVAISYALPVVVSLVGIVMARRSLVAYTEPGRMSRAVAAAEQTLSQEDGVQMFFCEQRRTRSARLSLLLFLLPILLFTIGMVVYCIAMENGDVSRRFEMQLLIGLIATVFIGLSSEVVGLLYLRPLISARECCYARDGGGTLWRVRLLPLNQNPSYQFKNAYLGLRPFDFAKMPQQEQALLQASIVRAIQDIQQGRVFPGSPLTKAVLPLTGLTVQKERPWGWKCTYENAQGKQTGLRVPSAYTGRFHPEGPLPAGEEEKVMRMHPLALLAGLLPVLLSVAITGAFVLSAL